MNELNYRKIETESGWKKFWVMLFVALFLFVFYEFDFIENASAIFFILFWISLIALIYYLADSIIISFNHRLFPKFYSFAISFVLIVSMLLIHCYRNGLFWGSPILEAAFIDELSRMDLELYKNKRYLLVDSWMFGSEQYLGNYQINGDTISLSKFPLTRDSIGIKKLFRNSNSLYFEQDSTGQYDTTFYKFRITSPKE